MGIEGERRGGLVEGDGGGRRLREGRVKVGSERGGAEGEQKKWKGSRRWGRRGEGEGRGETARICEDVAGGWLEMRKVREVGAKD